MFAYEEKKKSKKNKENNAGKMIQKQRNDGIIQRINFEDPLEPVFPNPVNSQIAPGTPITPTQSAVAFTCNSSGSHAMIFLENYYEPEIYANLRIHLQAHHNDRKEVSGTVKKGQAQVDIEFFGMHDAKKNLHGEIVLQPGIINSLRGYENNILLYGLRDLKGHQKHLISRATAAQLLVSATRLKQAADAGTIKYNYYTMMLGDTSMNCASFAQYVANATATAIGPANPDYATLHAINATSFYGFKTPKALAGL